VRADAHPVVDALRERPDGARIALVVEGGGMRGAVSGGMALALDELGLSHAFDAAYGSSAGTLNAMWLLSNRIRDGIPTWTDPELVRELISWRRVIGRRPVVDLKTLVEKRYEQLAPGLFGAVLASRTELHPIATEVSSGEAADLHESIKDPVTLRLAIRASATLPLLAGSPVTLGGRRFVDAGLSAAIPFRAALADGATHILLLRSRQLGEVAGEPKGMSARLMARMLRRIDPAVAAAFLTRARREGEDERLLAKHDRDPRREPYILSVRPLAGSPVPSRLERDTDLVRAALEAGRDALHRALSAVV
jgi:predicted patatin/cPLA2 family phospholipase